MKNYRRIRVRIEKHSKIPSLRKQGQVETELLKFAEAHADSKPYVMRPAMFISQGMSLHSLVFGLGPSVKVDVLAKSMIELALKGGDKAIWENADME
ncbi:hypothetical protein N7490_008301 [Penicillium lividum]|nr:hypothetical protein N7490_008301 [Penicillium lividum]